MRVCISRLLAIASFGVASLVGSAQTFAQKAYITNSQDNTVSVIGTATNTVISLPIPVGNFPFGVAVSLDGRKVYVGNQGGFQGLPNTVSVIDTLTNAVVATIPLGAIPTGLAVTPDGSNVYVANIINGGSVSVIDTATNTVVGSPIQVGLIPEGVAVTPDGSKVYVTNGSSDTVSVIDTATNIVSATIPVGGLPFGVAVTPDGSKVYVAHRGSHDVRVISTATNTVVNAINFGDQSDRLGVAIGPDGRKVYVVNVIVETLFSVKNTVAVIDTATDTAVGSILVGSGPVGDSYGISVTPDGSKVYVANNASDTVSVIDTASNMVVAVTPVGIGKRPIAFGVFIQPRFAGTRGTSNCHGQSVSALARTFGGLNAAAIALGLPNVRAVHTAVNAFCGATS